MTQRTLAIGDIHGDLGQLERIMAFIDADRTREGITNYQVIFIGDLTDRRDQSKGVLDYLLDGLTRNEPWIILRGNHDRMFSLFLEENGAQDPILRKDLTWLHPRLGGNTTMASYGVDALEDRDPVAIHGRVTFEGREIHFAKINANKRFGLLQFTDNKFCESSMELALG